MRTMPHVPSEPVPRVATLLPSLTEIVASVCPESVVAITHECDHPEDVVQRALRVTTSDITPHTMTQEEIDRQVKGSLRNGHSLYGLKEDLLKQADPQIVFTQALCDVCAPAFPLVVSTCARLLGDNPKVYSIEPTGLNEVLESVRTVGKALGREERAEQVVARLRKGCERIKAAVDGKPRKKVAFLEWTEPLFCGGHWIPDMMDLAGADYSLATTGNRSVEISPETLQKQDPDIILVAPCGFGKERAAGDTRKLWKHDWWRDLRAVNQGQVYALDANRYYARPGPRLLEGTGIVARLLHGDDIVPLVGEHIAMADWIRVTVDDEA